MHRSLPLTGAWRRALLGLAILYGFAIGLGLWQQTLAWALFIATALVAGQAYWQLGRLLRRLDGRQPFQTVHGQGLWAALASLIQRRQTENRTRNRRLLALLRAYRQAATAMPDGALILERRQTTLLWFNKAARRRLGLHYPQSLGQRLTDLLPNPRLRDWLAAGNTEEPLLDLASPTDPQVRLGLRLLPYSAEQWLLIVRDITQLTRLEQMRRDFVANVSHELRTPLTVIHGYLDLMEPGDNPEWEPLLAEMRKQSQRMTQLVEDLLTLSRLEAQEHLPEEPIAMAPLLTTLKREAEALSQGRHRITIDDQAQCDLIGSAKELHSAFSNLVSNAVRYTPTDGQVAIRLFRTADGGAALAVQDSGYGIPTQHIPRITERFYRVSTSRSRESGGTGLGLSIVKHVLNLHQGRFEIESEVGRGSTFTCLFGAERVRARQSAAGC